MLPSSGAQGVLYHEHDIENVATSSPCLELGYIAAAFFCIATYASYLGYRWRCLEDHRFQRQKKGLSRMTRHDQSSTVLCTNALRHDFRGPSRPSSMRTKSPKLRLLPQQHHTSRLSSLEADIPRHDFISDATAWIKKPGRLMEHLIKLDQEFSAAEKPARRPQRSFSANDAVDNSNSSRQTPRSVKSMHDMTAIQTLSQTFPSMKRSLRSDRARAWNHFDRRETAVSKRVGQNAPVIQPVAVSSSSRFYAAMIKRQRLIHSSVPVRPTQNVHNNSRHSRDM